jgi:hypothetical protein
MLSDSFSAVPRELGPVFMFCAPRLIFGGKEGVGSHFHVLRSRARFRWYRERWVPFSCFARPNLFSAVPRKSGPAFMFCSLGLFFGGSEGVEARFHVLRYRICFWRCEGRRLLFSCFALPNSFCALPRVSAFIFMFSAPELVFVGTYGIGSCYHFLRSRTCF